MNLGVPKCIQSEWHCPSDHKTEQAVLELARYVLIYPLIMLKNAPLKEGGDVPDRLDEILNVFVPIDPAMPYSMHTIIETVVDKGSF